LQEEWISVVLCLSLLLPSGDEGPEEKEEDSVPDLEHSPELLEVCMSAMWKENQFFSCPEGL
jgi:hypothetical protein